MNKLFFFFAACLLLTSCQMTERVFIKQDGSVRYEFSIQSSRMAKSMSASPKIDSLRKIGKFPIDTIVPLSKMDDLGLPNLPQSNKDSKKYQELAKKAKLHLIMNDNTMDFTIFFERESIAALNTYANALEKAKEEQGSEESSENKDDKENVPFFDNVRFNYDGKTFTRHSEVAAQPKTDTIPSGLSKLSEMMTVKLEYHFPKPIKTCSIEEATFSLDRKTMYAEVSYTELNTNPEKYNFTITF